MKLFNVLQTSFKPHHVVFILCILLTAFHKKKIYINRFIVALIFLIIPVLPLYRISDALEWVKSYVIWVIAVVYFAYAFPEIKNLFQKNRRTYIKIYVNLMILVQIISIVQFLTMNYLGFVFLNNFFGSLQYISPYMSSKSGIYRAFAIFHEPSVLGWVNSSALAVVLYSLKENIFSQKYLIVFHILCLLTMLCSLSAVGMISYFAIWFVYLMLNVKNRKILAMIAISFFLLIYLWNFTTILNPIRRITLEVNEINTSGYERLNAPRQFAIKTLKYYPILGRGIGQSGSNDLVGTISTALSQEANNSFYQMIMNFGLSSIALIILFVKTMLKRIKSDINYLIIVFNVLIIFVSTGAYLSMDFVAILNIMLLVFKGKENKNEDIMGL
jgi:hypothetical protein